MNRPTVGEWLLEKFNREQYNRYKEILSGSVCHKPKSIAPCPQCGNAESVIGKIASATEGSAIACYRIKCYACGYNMESTEKFTKSQFHDNEGFYQECIDKVIQVWNDKSFRRGK